MGGESEERTLAASKRKLDKARRKGQVPRSKDLAGAASLAATVGFVLLGASGMVAAVMTMFEVAGDAAAGPFVPGLNSVLSKVVDTVLHVAAPVYGLAVTLAVLASTLAMGGIPFSTEPITPKADNISPVEGFKRIFKMRSLVELLKSLAKVVLLATILVIVLAGGMRALFLAPGCGMECVQGAFGHVAGILLPAVVAVFLTIGLLDVGLQRWLFLRDQRMSVSESKRERKDVDGDPHIRGERRKLNREAAQGPARLGIAEAVLLLHDGGQAAAGLRFRRGETPVPVSVCRARGERARLMIVEAQRLGIPLAEDAELARMLVARVEPGRPIPESMFRSVAQILARTGLA